MAARRLAGLAAVLAGAALAVSAMLPGAAAPGRHFADAGDTALVVRGRAVYRDACASCHGRNLQGQPLWQLRDRYAGRRAPAHDGSGHTWQHDDEELFRLTKFGGHAGPPSAMPAFAGRLGDDEIVAVLAFIKARWPLAMRVAQATLNPDEAGMPPGAGAAEWRFPPNCFPGHPPPVASGG